MYWDIPPNYSRSWLSPIAPLVPRVLVLVPESFGFFPDSQMKRFDPKTRSGRHPSEPETTHHEQWCRTRQPCSQGFLPTSFEVLRPCYYILCFRLTDDSDSFMSLQIILSKFPILRMQHSHRHPDHSPASLENDAACFDSLEPTFNHFTTK